MSAILFMSNLQPKVSKVCAFENLTENANQTRGIKREGAAPLARLFSVGNGEPEARQSHVMMGKGCCSCTMGTGCCSCMMGTGCCSCTRLHHLSPWSRTNKSKSLARCEYLTSCYTCAHKPQAPNPAALLNKPQTMLLCLTNPKP